MKRSIVALVGVPAGLLWNCRAEKDVQVVVAHYAEDLKWIKEASDAAPTASFVVYTKGPKMDDATTEVLPNVGREAHTYLHHIVNNYDNLSPWTVFTQGAAPRWGYRKSNPENGHLTDNVTFSDYVQAFYDGKESFFPISAATHLPEGLQTTRLGMLSKSAKLSNAECPADGADGWSAWWSDANNLHHKKGKDMLTFYQRYVLGGHSLRSDVLKPITLGFAQGSRFAVSRERIQARPRDFYVELLAVLSQSQDPLEGYFLETMWYDVFSAKSQRDVAVCEYPALPRGWGMPEAEMMVDVARRLNAAAVDVTVSLQDAYNPQPGSARTTSSVAAGLVTAMMIAFAMSA